MKPKVKFVTLEVETDLNNKYLKAYVREGIALGPNAYVQVRSINVNVAQPVQVSLANLRQAAARAPRRQQVAQ